MAKNFIETRYSMVQVALKYASICGIFLTIIFHVSFLFDSNPLIDVSHLIFDLLILGLFIFFGQKEFKSYHAGQYFHFWQGMTIGFLIYTVATFIFSALFLIYFEVSTEALVNYKAEALEFLSSKKEFYTEEFGSEGFQQQMDSINQITASDLAISATVKKLLAGFFITPVISIILRKQPK
ncbi:MAG: DUF4199 domain-containing protein [Cyclobacteriaceae bacterium]